MSAKPAITKPKPTPPVPPKPSVKPSPVATVTMGSPKFAPKSSPKSTPRGPKPTNLPPKPSNVQPHTGVNDILKQARMPSATLDGKENKPQVAEKPADKPVKMWQIGVSCFTVLFECVLMYSECLVTLQAEISNCFHLAALLLVH